MNGHLRHLCIAALLVFPSGAWSGLQNSKHDLSVDSTATGNYKAQFEQQDCVFCHTPHNANPQTPLWNRVASGQTYQVYSSKTLVAKPGQPTRASRLCLSCHDGMIALGSVNNYRFGGRTGTAGVVQGLEESLSGTGNLGTDLTDDHPISFTYDDALAGSNPELIQPSTLAGLDPESLIKPDHFGELQCTSCHDPHDDQNPKFLHVGSTDIQGYGSPLCRTCHSMDGWSTGASHRDSASTWNGSLWKGEGPWHLPGHNNANDYPDSTPMANGCESCHKQHGGEGPLLKQDGESDVCLVCHNGSVATKDITVAMDRSYSHPSMDPSYAGRHIPERVNSKVRELAANLGWGESRPDDPTTRHAECSDCHNAHASSSDISPIPTVGALEPPQASNRLKGVWGVEPVWPGNFASIVSYTEVDGVEHEYQLCLKCHSSYAFGNNPPIEPYGIGQYGLLTDQAQEFNAANASYHPVVAKGKNAFLALDDRSLIGVDKNSTMTCGACHSDNGGGSSTKGPHGSDVWPILGAPYDPGETGKTGKVDGYLCFSCHDKAVYVSGTDPQAMDKTGFSGPVGVAQTKTNLHTFHTSAFAGAGGLPCLTCHAAVPHGWKRRAMLVFGTGTPDEAPYNAHNRNPIGGNSFYGINSGVALDTIQSGNWTRSDCHDASAAGTSGVTGVGSCSSP